MPAIAVAAKADKAKYFIILVFFKINVKNLKVGKFEYFFSKIWLKFCVDGKFYSFSNCLFDFEN